MSNQHKPILCLDFDGVLHSYLSGWQGAAVIPDAPTKGAIEFLARAVKEFEVHIFSSRSCQAGGIEAMRAWLRTHVTRHYDCEFAGSSRDFDKATALLDAIRFSENKPSAMVTIDDRAICFDGKWPHLSDLKQFKPWNKRPLGATGKYPQGQLNDDDEGELRFAVGFDPVDGIVRLEFGKPVAWIGLPPNEARELAALLLRHANGVTP